MSSVLSTNSATSTNRAAAPVAARPVDGLLSVAKAATATPASVNNDKSGLLASADPASATPVSASSTPVTALPKAELARQVHALQDKMDKLNPSLAFVVDQDSGRALIQLTDRATKEVIQQFPSEAALQISKALDRYQKGQLIHLTA